MDHLYCSTLMIYPDSISGDLNAGYTAMISAVVHNIITEDTKFKYFRIVEFFSKYFSLFLKMMI
jgi:hypothetical protein